MKQKLGCILLIDDNPLTNLFSEKLIQKLNIAEEIRAVENGQEAIDYLNNNGKFTQLEQQQPSPELILLDINMPVMDGWGFLAEFNKMPESKKKQTTIIMLSSSPNPEDKQKARADESVRDYKVKPLTKEALHEIMEKHFQDYF